jgi:hypothetical protein
MMLDGFSWPHHHSCFFPARGLRFFGAFLSPQFREREESLLFLDATLHYDYRREKEN